MAILFDGRYSAGFVAGLSKQSEDNATRITLVPDPAGSGVQVGKFTLLDSDAAHRAEVFPSPNVTRDFGTGYWYSWEYFLPSDFKFGGSGETSTVLCQVHDVDVAATPRHPAFAVDTKAGVIYARNANDTFDNTSDRILAQWPIVLGSWEHIVLNVSWSFTPGVGYMTVWRNRRKVFWETAHINTWTESPSANNAPYFKEGTYIPQPYSYGSQTTYHKGIVVGDSSYATFDQFMSACGTPDRFELEPICISRASLG